MPMVEPSGDTGGGHVFGIHKSGISGNTGGAFLQSVGTTNQHVRVISRSAADQVITRLFVPAHLRKAAHHLPAPNLL